MFKRKSRKMKKTSNSRRRKRKRKRSVIESLLRNLEEFRFRILTLGEES